MPFGGATLGKRLLAGPELGGIVSGAVGLPAGFAVHLKNGTGLYEDAAKTTPTTAGQVIGAWENQAVGGQDYTQATGTKKPLEENGGAAFDGFDDYLTEAADPVPPASFTVFVKLHVDVPTSRQFPFGSADAGATTFWSSCDVTTPGKVETAINESGIGSTKTITDAAFFSAGTDAVLTIRYTTGQTTIEMWKDGGAVATTDTATAADLNTPGTNPFSLGRLGAFNGLYHGGTIKEFVRYHSALSDADRAAAEAYMATV